MKWIVSRVGNGVSRRTEFESRHNKKSFKVIFSNVRFQEGMLRQFATKIEHYGHEVLGLVGVVGIFSGAGCRKA